MKIRELSNLLRKLRIIEQKLVKEFEMGTGFSLAKYEILMYLSQREPSLQNEIAEYVGIDPAAVTRHLKMLEMDGFVIRERNPKNAREVLVQLTDFAKEKLKDCASKEKQSQGCNVSLSFSEKELKDFIEVLEKMEDIWN